MTNSCQGEGINVRATIMSTLKTSHIFPLFLVVVKKYSNTALYMARVHEEGKQRQNSSYCPRLKSYVST